MLAQKPNVRVIKERLGRLDRDVIFEKDVKKNAQLIKQVRQRLGSTDNIINVGSGPGTDALQDVIYLTLDVGNQVDVSHNWNLESFLAAVSDDSKHKAVSWMKEILVKEKSSI